MSQSINSNVRAPAEEDTNKGKNGPLFIALQKNTKTRKHLRLTGSAVDISKNGNPEIWEVGNIPKSRNPGKKFDVSNHVIKELYLEDFYSKYKLYKYEFILYGSF